MVVVILSIDSATSTIYLHVKQTEGTETANVSFDLGAATMEYGNNAPYFQWGRKDPLPPSTGLTNANKPIYGTYTALNNMSTADIAVTIRTPYYFNNNNGNPSLELWNVGNTATTVNVDPIVKSIYDPSPRGFHLPPSGAFQGWDTKERFYWIGTSISNNMYIYQLGPTTGVPVPFPLLAYKTGASYYSNEYSYWSVGASASVSGRGIYFYTSTMITEDTRYRKYALICRPVSE